MTKNPFLGKGFALLRIRDSTLNGDLAGWPDAALSTLVVLGAHADQEGDAYPGWQRIATLGGLSKLSLGPALKHLEKTSLIEIHNRARRRSYRIALGEYSDSVHIWQTVVFSGLWSACTPAARKLYITFQALSRPGSGDADNHMSTSEWRDAVEQGLDDDGCRHVPAENAVPSKLGHLAGLPDRTRRDAMERLFGLKLIQDPEDFDGGLVLPNNPGCYIPEVLKALEQSDTSQSTPSPGAKRSATWRRRRSLHPAESLPVGEKRRRSPIENPASPNSSALNEKVHPAD